MQNLLVMLEHASGARVHRTADFADCRSALADFGRRVIREQFGHGLWRQRRPLGLELTAGDFAVVGRGLFASAAFRDASRTQ